MSGLLQIPEKLLPETATILPESVTVHLVKGYNFVMLNYSES